MKKAKLLDGAMGTELMNAGIQPGSFSKIGRAYQQYQTGVLSADLVTAKLPYMFPQQYSMK